MKANQIGILSKLLIISGFSILFSACTNSGSGGGSSSSGGKTLNDSIVSYSTALTISDIGTIPQLAGSGTSSVLYIHNHSDKNISRISYRILNKSTNLSFELTPASKDLCSSIAQNQNCPLSFTSLINSNKINTASVEVELSYTLNNKPEVFKQLLNIRRFENINDGMLFSSSLVINGYGNKEGYGTVYLLNTGNPQHKSYGINSLKLNTPGLKITHGEINNAEVPSGFIQAIEIKSPILSQAIGAELSVGLDQNSKSLNKSDNISTSIYPSLPK